MAATGLTVSTFAPAASPHSDSTDSTRLEPNSQRPLERTQQSNLVAAVGSLNPMQASSLGIRYMTCCLTA